MPSRLLLLLLPLALAACEQLGLDDAAKIAAAKEAEGKAIGSGCRHTGRSLEDCYALNPKAIKAAIFAGWRDMDTYMRENKIETVASPNSRAKLQDEVSAGDGKPADAKTADTPPAEAKAGEGKPASDKGKEAAKPPAKH